MRRRGQGKPMAEQAARLLKQHLALESRHAAKQAGTIQGSRSTGQIHSLGTFQKYVSSLKNAGEWAKAAHDVRHLKELSLDLAQAYLAHRAAQGIGQKQLDADRNALRFIVGGPLPRVRAETAPKHAGRAYTAAQVERIIAHQNEANALSTRIAYEAGLRAHELLTLQRADEAQAAGHRLWREERFWGRPAGRIYIVTGKGGLKREVQLSPTTAQALEKRRLETPITVYDRGIRYQQHYAISGGQRWSQSFQSASTRALGWSTGAHGLRHSYAQARLRCLQARGLRYDAAREVVSQELGHFRGNVTETYLR